MSQEETITISVKEYNKLKKDARLLECLYNAGVDNWDGWDDAITEFEGEG